VVKKGKDEEDSPRDSKDKSKRLPKSLRPKGPLEKRPRRVKPSEPLLCNLCRQGTHVHDFGWANCKCGHANHGLPKDKR
jgi:hypothetical protein